MSAPNNPNAFPLANGGPMGANATGMTLRDWFAGQCLPGVMSQAENMGSLTEETRHEAWAAVAGFVYEMADAMLAARALATGETPR